MKWKIISFCLLAVLFLSACYLALSVTPDIPLDDLPANAYFTVKTNGVDYWVIRRDGYKAYETTTAINSLQYAVDNLESSGGLIWVDSAFDAGTSTLTITKDNVCIDTGLYMQQETGSSHWHTPRIQTITYDSTSGDIDHGRIAGFAIRDLNFYANGNAIQGLIIERMGFRPTSAGEGIHLSGSSITYYITLRDCGIMDAVDRSAEAAFLYSTSTGEGNGQWFISNINYKCRADNAAFIGVSSNGRFDQLIEVSGLSFVCYGGYDDSSLVHINDGILRTLFVHDSYFECHDNVTLFRILNSGTNNLFAAQIHDCQFTGGDSATDILKLINNSADNTDWVSWAMSYLYAHDIRIQCSGTGGTFSEGTTGAGSRFTSDFAEWKYWIDTTLTGSG